MNILIGLNNDVGFRDKLFDKLINLLIAISTLISDGLSIIWFLKSNSPSVDLINKNSNSFLCTSRAGKSLSMSTTAPFPEYE